MAQTSTKSYYYTDPQGTVLAKADAQGNIVETYDYAPYGTQVLGTPPEGPTGYTGHVNDAESGFVYMQQRYMDPQSGRFLSVDPVTVYSGDLRHFSRYTYAYNNPPSFNDPDGLAPNKAGVTGSLHVYNALQKGNLADLRNSHSGNKNRYFYTEKFGWIDIRHFAEAARMVSEGTPSFVVRALGFGNEINQWITEWGDDYRSGFSQEDLPSNDAGINFAESLEKGESLASGFSRWAEANGAAADPTGPTTGYKDLPANDPSSHGGENRGKSNTSSTPAVLDRPVIRTKDRD